MSRLLIHCPLPTAVTSAGVLGAAAAIALLAGCSGSSQYAPSAIGGAGTMGSTTSTMHHGMSRVAMPFASQQANEAFLRRPIVSLDKGRITVRHDIPCNRPVHGLTFASENTTGRLDVFCGGRPLYPITSGQSPFLSIAGVGGWGVAVHGNLLAVGTSGGTIITYTLPGLTNPRTLTLAHSASGYNAFGLAFDSMGGLYATEWPGPYVDYWRTPSANGAVNCTTTTTVNTEDYFVAAHGANSAVVYGLNGNSPNDDVDTELITNMRACSGETDSFIETFGQLAQGTGFPGGIVSGRLGELYVNNQYGTLYDDGAYPGGTVGPSCTWGSNPNDVTNINLSTDQQSIWGSNVTFAGATYLESFRSSGLAGTCVTGPVGGPTINITGNQYLGVASWRNRGN